MSASAPAASSNTPTACLLLPWELASPSLRLPHPPACLSRLPAWLLHTPTCTPRPLHVRTPSTRPSWAAARVSHLPARVASAGTHHSCQYTHCVFPVASICTLRLPRCVASAPLHCACPVASASSHVASACGCIACTGVHIASAGACIALIDLSPISMHAGPPLSESANVVLWGEFSGQRSGVWEYAPGSNGVAERYGDLVGV
jgi:hypothetical protein